MTENQMNHEELEHEALAQQSSAEQEPAPYVERPRSQRILAWILAGLVTVGVLLYLGWIAGILH